MTPRRALRVVATAAVAAVVAASCGSDGGSSADDATVTTEIVDTAPVAPESADGSGDDTGEAGAGLRLVSAGSAADVIAAPPDDLVVLDIRTPGEFDSGHLDGAVLIDFYRDDFGAQLATLDPDVPYVLYCNSGNRSGVALEMMRELGFVDVAEVDGGIVAWQQAGLPITND